LHQQDQEPLQGQEVLVDQEDPVGWEDLEDQVEEDINLLHKTLLHLEIGCEERLQPSLKATKKSTLHGKPSCTYINWQIGTTPS
jgi:hypothetical protein